MAYATYAQFTNVYSPKDITQATIEAYWLPHGDLRVNEVLGGHFTTPFSTNNATARDLCIHYAYLGILVKTRKPDDSTELMDYLSKRVDDIRNGNTPMITDAGVSFSPTEVGGDIWSTSQAYKPTFDVRDSVRQRIDPDLLEALEDADS